VPRSASHQTQITLRSLDPRLVEEIRRLARAEGISLNKATLRLLRRGAGLDEKRAPHVVGHSLDHLIGTWDDEEARRFQHAVRSCERIDKAFWK
jgi:hypothetical protein